MNIKNLLILITCTIVISFNSACFAVYIAPEKYGTPDVVFPYSGLYENLEGGNPAPTKKIGFELVRLNLAKYPDTSEKPSSRSLDWAWKELYLALQSLQQDKIDEDDKAGLTKNVMQGIDAVFAEKEKVVIENRRRNSYLAKYIAQSLLKVNKVKSLFCDIPGDPSSIRYLAAYLSSPKAKLTELDLNANLCNEDISVYLGEALRSNTSLRKLIIKSMEIEDIFGIKGIDYSLALEDYSTPTIEGEIISKGIGAGLATNTGLESLSIVYANFSDEGLAALLDAVSKNKTLRTLELADCTKPFGPKSLKSLSNLLTNNTALTALYLGGEDEEVFLLTKELLEVLVEAFAVNKTLKHLDLTGISELDSEKTAQLLEGLKKNDTLESLCMGRIHDEDWPESKEEVMKVDILLSLLKQNKTLKYLELRDLRNGAEEKINMALLNREITTRVQLDPCHWDLQSQSEGRFTRLYDPIEMNKAFAYLAKEIRKEKMVKILESLPGVDSPLSYLPHSLFREFATFYTKEVVDDGITDKILYGLLKGTIDELGTFLNVKDKKVIKAINTLRGCYNELQAACFPSMKGVLQCFPSMEGKQQSLSLGLKTLFVPLPYDGTREEDYISLPEVDFEIQRCSFLEMVTQEYIKQLRHGQMWGGDIELGRLANLLNLNIEITDRLHDTTFNINCDHPDATTRNIHLLYDGTHYRLINHGTIIDVPRDGDCMFHAILCFLLPDYMTLSTEERTKHVIALRQAIANQLEIEAFGQPR